MFKNFGISDVKITCGRQPLHVDFSENKYSFNQLFEALDLARDKKGNDINSIDYKNTH